MGGMSDAEGRQAAGEAAEELVLGNHPWGGRWEAVGEPRRGTEQSAVSRPPYLPRGNYTGDGYWWRPSAMGRWLGWLDSNHFIWLNGIGFTGKVKALVHLQGNLDYKREAPSESQDLKNIMDNFWEVGERSREGKPETAHGVGPLSYLWIPHPWIQPPAHQNYPEKNDACTEHVQASFSCHFSLNYAHDLRSIYIILSIVSNLEVI